MPLATARATARFLLIRRAAVGRFDGQLNGLWLFFCFRFCFCVYHLRISYLGELQKFNRLDVLFMKTAVLPKGCKLGATS